MPNEEMPPPRAAEDSAPRSREGIEPISRRQFLLRNAVQDRDVCATHIPAGSIVNTCIGAANRDETVYDDPDRFDIFRERRQHVTFGWGPHMCLGMHLARMETRVAINAILDRLERTPVEEVRGPHLVPGAAQPVRGLAHRGPQTVGRVKEHDVHEAIVPAGTDNAVVSRPWTCCQRSGVMEAVPFYGTPGRIYCELRALFS